VGANVGDSRTVDVHVRWLRTKLEEDPANPKHLMSVRCLGDRFDPPDGPGEVGLGPGTLIDS
jgi:DNA-binding response OmpR family regulator